MRRILTATLVGLLLTPTAILAADDDRATTPLAPAAAIAATSTLAQRADLTASADSVSPRRPRGLPALYAGSAFLQGYDAYSTLTVLKHGGVEANPVMKGVTQHPAAFIGLKAGVTAMSIMAAERMWKNNNRLGAVLTMAATNGAMAAVAVHNARVMGTVR